jgi:hypothetical protein
MLCLGLFAGGLVRILLWRFEAGDVYPPYSSLRADPLGAMALFESLGTLPGRRSERFLEPTSGLPDGQARCLLLLGSPPTLAGSRLELAHLDRFVAAGGRVLIALDARRPRRDDAKAGEEPDPSQPAPAAKERPEAKDEAQPMPPPTVPRSPTEGPSGGGLRVTLDRHWGYAVRPGVLGGSLERVVEATLADEHEVLPPSLPWRGEVGLSLHDPHWQSLYAADNHPVVAYRRLGQGLVVLAADSYLFSNEGLRQCPQPEFLSWVIGPATHILFDETHFGIQHRRGIMALARQYRLHTCFAALVALALLVVWHGSSRLAPTAPASAAPNTISGRPAHSALRDLLQRHTPPEKLLEHCVEAWARTASARPGNAAQTTLDRLHDCLRRQASEPGPRRHLARDYRDLCEIVARKD